MKIFLTILTISGLFMLSCQKDNAVFDVGKSSGVPKANEVWIQNSSFIPSTIIIKKGATITFINKDISEHTVTADDNSFDSGTISSGKSYSRVFPEAIGFNYHCVIHPEMKGSVIVN